MEPKVNWYAINISWYSKTSCIDWVLSGIPPKYRLCISQYVGGHSLDMLADTTVDMWVTLIRRVLVYMYMAANKPTDTKPRGGQSTQDH